MTLPAADETVLLHPTRDGRLLLYTLLAVGGLAASLLAADPTFAALAAPFAVAVLLGLRRTGSVPVRVRVFLEADRVLEGDPVRGRLEISWPGSFRVRVRLHRLSGVAAAPDGETAWSLPDAENSVDLPLEMEATGWGLHRMMEVWIRLETPSGLLTWTGKLLTGPLVRILPGRESLSRLLDPANSRAVWGMHPSRALGDGHEFAELRPYSPGDRVRDLNWAATARRGRPYVNRHHPELAGEVIIALDAFSDGSTVATESLSRAARVAWTLASAHLRANDRVGIVGFGGSTRWLAASGGRKAQYQILETLLEIGGDAARHAAAARRAGQPSIPGSALVIALTPLHDPATLGILAGWRFRGRAVSVLALDTEETLPPPATPAERLARRLWSLELGHRKRALGRIGIPVVSVPSDGAISPAVALLRRSRRTPSVAGGRR